MVCFQVHFKKAKRSNKRYFFIFFLKDLISIPLQKTLCFCRLEAKKIPLKIPIFAPEKIARK